MSSCGSPSCGKGSFFPAILERRRPIDRALFAVVIEAYVHGVSTRRVDDPVAALGLQAGISKSEVSRICAELDTSLEAFRTRPVGHVEFPYVFLDATYIKARESERGRARTCWRFRRSRSRTGRESGPPTPSSGSTKRSSTALTSWGSSPTKTRSCDW
jgi:hypothetical protein